MQIIILIITLCFVLLAYHFGSLMSIIIQKKKRIPTQVLGVRSVDGVGDDETHRGDVDEIYPVHFIDQAAIVRSSLISYTFRYNHILNAGKLHDSLVMLLTHRDWRKLGGRLRQNVRMPESLCPRRTPN